MSNEMRTEKESLTLEIESLESKRRAYLARASRLEMKQIDLIVAANEVELDIESLKAKQAN